MIFNSIYPVKSRVSIGIPLSLYLILETIYYLQQCSTFTRPSAVPACWYCPRRWSLNSNMKPQRLNICIYNCMNHSWRVCITLHWNVQIIYRLKGSLFNPLSHRLYQAAPKLFACSQMCAIIKIYILFTSKYTHTDWNDI